MTRRRAHEIRAKEDARKAADAERRKGVKK